MAVKRPSRIILGHIHHQCFCPEHNGEWIRRTDFPGNKGNSVRKVCKKRWNYLTTTARYPNDLDLHGFVRISDVKKYVQEIIHRCGSVRRAQDVLECSATNILKWADRSKNSNLYVRRLTAARIYATLILLRNGEIQLPPLNNRQAAAKKVYTYGCSACGCDLEEQISGCRTCQDRAGKRRRNNESRNSG